MLLAEDLLLLLTDDDTGKHTVDATRLDLALAGAVLLELAERGAVEVAGPGRDVRPGRLVVRDGLPTGSAVLDGALAVLSSRPPAKPKDVLGRLQKGLRQRLLADLAAAGVLRAEQGRVLGVFPTVRWPADERAHESAVRQGLHDVLVTGRAPTAREASLVGLLVAVDAVPAALGPTSAGRRELRERARQVAQGGFAGEAVRKALEEIQATVIAAVAVSGAAAASS